MFYAKRGGKNLFRPAILPIIEEKQEKKNENKVKAPRNTKKNEKAAPVNNTVEIQKKEDEGNKLEQD